MVCMETVTEPRSEFFEEQILEHMDGLYLAALKMTRNVFDAQDLVHDVVLRALRFHGRFQEGTYIKAWLFTILKNTFINDFRKKARRPALVELTGAEPSKRSRIERDLGYTPTELHSKDVLETLGEDLRRAIDDLPEGHRRTVIMADLQDMSYREIADEMDCPVGTVMSRLHRGRRQLRHALAPTRHREQVVFG